MTDPQAAGSAAPVSSATPVTTSFEASAPRQEKSGEALVVYAYAFCWIAVLAFVVLAWRRTRVLEDRISELMTALGRARDVPKTKKSAKEAEA